MDQSTEGFVKLRTDDVAWRQVGDEVMLLDTNTSQYLSVNRTGTALWPLLIDGCEASRLTQALVEEFEVDQARASADAEAFLSSLRELGLLQEGASL
ncbi:MAG: PqqD family protein [Acidimicrobiales bacterium]